MPIPSNPRRPATDADRTKRLPSLWPLSPADRETTPLACCYQGPGGARPDGDLDLLIIEESARPRPRPIRKTLLIVPGLFAAASAATSHSCAAGVIMLRASRTVEFCNKPGSLDIPSDPAVRSKRPKRGRA